MQLSFIIPLYNCLPLAQAMLASLQATLPAGLAHEIILIDDGSTDGTREWLQTLAPPCRIVLNERNLGYAKTNNRGAALAGGEILALLNDDLVLLPGWLPPMLRALHRPGAGIVGNIQLDARSGAVDHTGIVVNLKGKPEHARTLPPRWSLALLPIRRRPAVTGACLLIPRALWQQLGGFDENFVNGGEDVDLCFRAREAGRETLVAFNSVVRHHVSSSPGRKLRDEENSFRLAKRWRHTFIREATRAWCRDCLARTFAQPDFHDHLLALGALLHVTGLRRRPPPEAIASLDAALALEFERWKRMLG